MRNLAIVAMSSLALLALPSGARAQVAGDAEVSIESIAALSDQAQRCTVSVSARDGGVIARGRVVLTSSFAVPEGKLGVAQWKLSGDRISGIVLSAEGAEIAQFAGVVREDVVEGSFTTRTGSSGTWRWEGGG